MNIEIINLEKMEKIISDSSKDEIKEFFETVIFNQCNYRDYNFTLNEFISKAKSVDCLDFHKYNDLDKKLQCWEGEVKKVMSSHFDIYGFIIIGKLSTVAEEIKCLHSECFPGRLNNGNDPSFVVFDKSYFQESGLKRRVVHELAHGHIFKKMGDLNLFDNGKKFKYFIFTQTMAILVEAKICGEDAIEKKYFSIIEYVKSKGGIYWIKEIDSYKLYENLKEKFAREVNKDIFRDAIAYYILDETKEIETLEELIKNEMEIVEKKKK